MTAFVVGYFGDGPWAHQALEGLLDDREIEVAFVCSRFRTPDLVLEELARRSGIVHLGHPDVNSDEFLDMIPSIDFDLFVSMSFDQIFRPRLIELPRLETINCHAGKLPFYRGRNVLNWVLINDEMEFGVTVHQVDEGVDTGDILAQRVFPITDNDNYATLLAQAHRECSDLLLDTIEALRVGTVFHHPQSEIHPVGSYCRRRSEGDERLNWDQSSRDVFNFVRAICRPGPEARTRLGRYEIRINSVEEMPQVRGTAVSPGTVTVVEAGCFAVATSDSLVRVVEWSGTESINIGDLLS